MTSFTELPLYAPNTSRRNNFVSFWELYETAARLQYGEGIRVIRIPRQEKMVNEIDFEVCVLSMGEPREVRRAIVDVNIKDYTNSGKEGQDESIIKVSKKTFNEDIDRYTFTTKRGINFGTGSKIGKTVMGLAVSGGSLHIAGTLDNTRSADHSDEVRYECSYQLEEKVTVPPGKHVRVKITSYAIKYEVDYTLKFSVCRDATIPLLYRTNCQHACFQICRSSGFVLVRDMISTLEDYNDEEASGMASFTQTGTLSWIGEGSTVDKEEELI